MAKMPCCEKVELNKGGWGALEDQILTNYIKANGVGQWRDLPKKAGLKRCGKSCRLRWLNYLNPEIIRGNITQEEDELIITMHKQVGNRWSLIAGKLPGRTDNEIKNYWNTILCRKVHGQHTVLPTPAEPSDTDFHAPISAESTDAEVTPRQSATPQETSTEFMCNTMPNMVNNEASQSRACHTPDSSQENNTEFMGDIMQYLANIEIPQSQCPIDDGCSTPRQFSGDIMQNDEYMEAPPGNICPPQQSDPSQEDNIELWGGILQNIANGEDPRYNDNQRCYIQEQSGSSVMAEIMHHTVNYESHQTEECYTLQKTSSSEGENTEFMGGIMQNNFESPGSHVYQECYHYLTTDLVTDEICMPARDKYSMHTSQDILSELAFPFPSDESPSEHWMTNTYADLNTTVDLGSLATLFEL